MKKLSLISFVFTLFASVAIAQDKANQGLIALKNQLYADFLSEQLDVKAYVQKTGLPARWSTKDKTFEIQKLDKSGKPIVLATESNVEAANTTGASSAWTGGSLGLNLNGQGMIIGEWDGGGVLRTHQEFTPNRVIQVDGATSVNFHATHVAGTLIGNGTSAAAKGMMHQGTLWAHDWTNDQSEMATAAINGLRISNHSYGWLTGWAQNSGSWYWYGNASVNATTDNQFGMYNSTAQQWDQVAFNAPNYLIVKSAGNDRGEGPSAGTSHFVWGGSSWVSSTATRDRDGSTSGYDCMSFSSVSKNILTVGAANRIAAGYSGPSSVVMSSFSSWGPTDDGRIKPDIVGAGVGLFSAYTPNNNSYASLSGTSMSGPNVAGSLGLVQQHAQNVRGSMLRGASLKGLAIHTANEAGSATGPDYVFGWGLMNVTGCINVINSAQTTNGIQENTLVQGGTYQINVFNDGSSPLEATISWYDPAGPVNSSSSFNERTARLVNDLDLRIIRVSDSNTELPWVLNPDVPSAAATKGDNVKDNVEKVSILNPVAGWYTIRVSHKGTLSGGQQNYSLIYTGGTLSQECSEPTVGGTATGPSSLTEGESGSLSLTGFSGSSVQWQSSTDMGNTWNNIASATSPTSSISLPVGSYQIRAAVSRLNCSISFSNFLNVTVTPLVGNTLSNPILVSTPYSGSISTSAGSGFTNAYTGLNNQASADVFFRITTGPCADSLAISTCASNFDTYLHLLDASGLNITSVDDNGPLCTGTVASIKRAILPNTTYFVVAEGYSTSTGTINITINEIDNPAFAPTITASGSTTFCTGGSVILSASAGSSYSWNTGATTKTISVNTSGSYSVTITDANGCSSSANQSVTVNPLPIVNISPSGPTTFCAGGLVILTASAGSSYSWSTGATTQTISVNTSGSYSVTVTDANGCSASANQSVTVNPLPIVNISPSGPTTFCAGGSVTLTASAGSSYSWNTGATTQTISVNTSGSYSVTVTNANGCSASANQSVTVNPLPTAFTLSGTGSYCSFPGTGASVSLSGSQTGVNYEFKFTAGGTVATVPGTGSLLNVNNVTGTGTLFVVATNASTGCFQNMNGSVGVFPIAATTYYRDQDGDGYGNAAISIQACSPQAGYVIDNTDCDDNSGSVNPGAAEICGNGIDDNCNGSVDEGCVTFTFYADADGDTFGNPLASITQGSPTAPNGYVSNNQDCDDTNPDVNPNAVEICNGIDDNCDGLIDNGVPSIAAPSAIGGPAGVCRNSTGQVFTVDPIPGATSYIWTLPAGATGSSTTNSITLAFSASYVTGNLCVRAANSCVQSENFCRSVVYYSARPGTPASIVGTTPVCPGSTATFSVPPLANATSYVWTAPANSTIISGQGTNSITLAFASNYVTATLSVRGSNCVGSSANRSLTIGTTTGIPKSISGPVLGVCAGSTQIYSCPVVKGASGYLWTAPPGATVVGGQGTNSAQIAFPAEFVNGNITVASTTACFTSANRTVNAKTALATPSVIVGPATQACPGDVHTYSVTGVSGLSYNWQVPAGATIVNGEGSNGIEVIFPTGFSSGRVRVRAENECGVSAFRSLTVRGLPALPGAITGAANGACAGDYTYSVAAVATATGYNWTLPVGWGVVSQANNSITVSIPGNFVTGVLSVAASNICGVGATRNLTVNGRPATPGAITGAASVCPNSQEVGYSVVNVTGFTYNWTLPTGASLASGAGESAVFVNFGAAGGSLRVSASNACGTSALRSRTIGLLSCREGVEDVVALEQMLSVYPNPGKGLYTLQASGFEQSGLVSVYNMVGQLVKTQLIDATTIENKLDLTALPSGAYLLKFESESFNKSLKIVKE